MRKWKITQEVENMIFQLKSSGNNNATIGRVLKISKQSVGYVLNGRKWGEETMGGDCEFGENGLFDVDKFFKSDFIYKNE